MNKGPYKVQIICSNPRKWKLHNFLIKIIEDTDYGHLAIGLIDTRTNQQMIYESSYGEAHYITRDNWLVRNKIKRFHEFYIDARQYEVGITILNQLTQTGYGYLNVVGALFHRLFGTRHNIFKDGNDSLFCSEVIAIVLQDVLGYSLNTDQDLFGLREFDQLMERQYAKKDR